MSSSTPSRRGASKAASKKKTGQSRLPAWLLLLTGFAAGFFVAFLIKLTPGPVEVPEVHTTETGQQSQEEPTPVFDFYTVLPESEVVLPSAPEKEIISVKPKPTVISAQPSSKPSVSPQTKTGKYLLQAGSFRSESDADRLRARLLLSGQSPRVVKVTVGTGETWHRVQLGPFETSESIDQARKVLADHKIEGLLLKVK